MNLESPAVLERLLRDNELGWMIDMYVPRERAVTVLLERLENLTAGFRVRFGHDVSFTPEMLADEVERNPHKIRAFLQALRITENSDMLLMVWRILQGLSIHEVAMHYLEQEAFNLSVTLAGRDELETYNTEDIGDAALLRHFGITTVDNTPLFDGFFPSRNR